MKCSEHLFKDIENCYLLDNDELSDIIKKTLFEYLEAKYNDGEEKITDNEYVLEAFNTRIDELTKCILNIRNLLRRIENKKSRGTLFGYKFYLFHNCKDIYDILKNVRVFMIDCWYLDNDEYNDTEGFEYIHALYYDNSKYDLDPDVKIGRASCRERV